MSMAKLAGEQVLVMFILIAVGYVFAKRKWITPQGSLDMNKMLLYIVNPCIIITSYYRPFDRNLFATLLEGILLAIISHAFSILLAFLTLRGKDDRRKLERFSLIFSNSGFMGIPLISALLGSEGVVLASIYIMIFTVTQWTVGVLILSGRSDLKTMLKQLLLNPGVISVFIGLSIFRFSLSLPKPLHTAMGYIANLNTPVAMIVVGTFIARTKVLASFLNKRVYIVSFLRLLILPILMVPVYMAFGTSESLMIANYVATACPVAALAAMFPAAYGYDPDYATGFITVSTLLSVITIPLMITILGKIFAF
ncbi:MAG: AEC family transporter [Clostridiales bacterium]|nr:AEC family transporter [Clostridiales bacterium]